MNVLRHLRATISAVGIFTSTLLIGLVMFATALLHLIPSPWVHRNVRRMHEQMSSFWALTLTVICPTPNWTFHGQEQLSTKKTYMMLPNHVSWSDIFALMRGSIYKVPTYKFFIKEQLKYLPIVGQAFMLVDYPMMKRYSKAKLAKHPELKGQDLAHTRAKCARYTDPATLVNFPEGTRLTKAKHAEQQSPYQHLLMPKSGGVAFALSAMNGKVDEILDVTICYGSQGVKEVGFWAYMGGAIPTIDVVFRHIPVTDDLLGDYQNDADFRAHFQNWINTLWAEKDAKLSELGCQHLK